MLNLARDVIDTCADSNRTRASASLFSVLREFHFMKGPDTEAIFSVVCSSDILEQHTIIKRLRHRLWMFVFTNKSDLPECRNDVMCMCRHFRSNVDSCYSKSFQ